MRAHAFAANELVLDVFMSRQIADVDLDSLLIYLCVVKRRCGQCCSIPRRLPKFWKW
jgi:hypothetical protein